MSFAHAYQSEFRRWPVIMQNTRHVVRISEISEPLVDLKQSYFLS